MGNTMRHLVFVEKGRLEWREAPTPVLQGDDEAIVRPLAAARCDLDTAILFGRAPIPGPFAIGHEFVGEVLEVGDAVRGFRPGDRVVVPFQISCGECGYCRRGFTGSCEKVPPGAMYGLGTSRGDWGGAVADAVRVPFASNMLVRIPDGISLDAIASVSDNVVDGWRTVAPHLRDLPGADVLIVAGGAWSVGLYAVAVALASGASKVDYLDTDRARLDLAEKLGARAIDGPPPKRVGRYAVTVDASSEPTGLACALCSTKPEGICTSVGIYFSETTPVPLNEMFYSGITFKTGRAHSRAGIEPVLKLISSGKLRPELITTRLAAWDDAPEAMFDVSPKVVLTRTA